jgi:hypothetical protein
LREFIDREAVPGGCREGYSKATLIDKDGPFRAHYLEGPNGVIYPLPPHMPDDEHLVPAMMASMARQLGFRLGPYARLYEHLI